MVRAIVRTVAPLVLLAILVSGCMNSWPDYSAPAAIRSTHVLGVAANVTIPPGAKGPNLTGGGEHCPWLEQQGSTWNMFLHQGSNIPDAVVHMTWDRRALEQARIPVLGNTINVPLKQGVTTYAPSLLSRSLYNVTFDGAHFLVNGQTVSGSLGREFTYTGLDSSGEVYSASERMTFTDLGAVSVGVHAQAGCM
jgi:hypothetical protein